MTNESISGISFVEATTGFRAHFDETTRRRDDETLDRGEPEGTAGFRTWVDELASLLEPGARILDLDCGAGIPATKILADAGLEVLGIDISEVQIERARALVPMPHLSVPTWFCGRATGQGSMP
ncbi:MAG: class I SAM-dependent methyltransferase [Acidimicrobiales bacterium]